MPNLKKLANRLNWQTDVNPRIHKGRKTEKRKASFRNVRGGYGEETAIDQLQQKLCCRNLQSSKTPEKLDPSCINDGEHTNS